MRVTSKAQLLEAIDREHETFVDLLEAVPTGERNVPGVWGDDWSVKDLVLHLSAWEDLFLDWWEAHEANDVPELPAPGYTWKETPRLNQDMQRRDARTSWKRAIENFDATFHSIRALAQRIPEKDLLEKKRFAWTGSTSVGSYLASNTASHYATASKILRRWKRRAKA